MDANLFFRCYIHRSFLFACLAVLFSAGCGAGDALSPEVDQIRSELSTRLSNIALGKPAIQSSTYAGGVASLAVDGNTNGFFNTGSVTHTGYDAQAYWQVDLGGVHAIGQIAVYNRVDCCYERLADFYVRISEDGEHWTSIFHPGTLPEPKWPIYSSRAVFDFHQRGRYVRVQLAGTHYLSLADVQVFPADRLNLALARPVNQSSTAQGGVAERAVDGRTDGRFSYGSVTHTVEEVGQWWQVDLGARYPIEEIVIYNRTDCCADRLRTYSIDLSDNGIDFEEFYYNDDHGGSVREVSYHQINWAARYVRIYLYGRASLSLAEVMVFSPRVENIARNEPATQSSTGYGGLASRAVDGNRNGDFFAGSVTHTNYDAQAFWRVDLGRVRDIGRVVVTNRTDGSIDRLANFYLRVSQDGVTWNSQYHPEAATEEAVFYVGLPARHVMVQLAGTNFLHLAEVEVFDSMAHVRPLDPRQYGDVSTVTKGYNEACAITPDRTVRCWGSNDPTTVPLDSPTGTFLQIASGRDGSCGLRLDGTLSCWGALSGRNYYASPPAGSFAQVTIANDYACALRADGSITCWGQRAAGAAVPTPPAGKFIGLAGGPGGATCGVRNDLQLFCFGDALLSQPPGAYVQVAVGYDTACAIRESDFASVCWDRRTPFAITHVPFRKVVVSADYRNGYDYLCGIKLDGTLYCGSPNMSDPPPDPVPAGTFAQLTGRRGYCAVRTDGTVLCFRDISTAYVNAEQVPPGLIARVD